MSKSITQDMAYRQSLMKYAEKYGVSRASRKYNKSRSYIYFWKARWDGTVQSLACQSRRPHSHPNQHTEAELKLIQDMRRRNPSLGMVELWHRLRQRGYTRRPESLFRVMRKLGLFPTAEKKKAYKPKPYEQMTRPGERVQVDVKVVPRKCIADPELRLFQYTAIDELTPELLRLFIQRIEIGERDVKYSRNASQAIRIIYRDIGLVDSAMQPDEQQPKILPPLSEVIPLPA